MPLKCYAPFQNRFTFLYNGMYGIHNDTHHSGTTPTLGNKKTFRTVFGLVSGWENYCFMNIVMFCYGLPNTGKF